MISDNPLHDWARHVSDMDSRPVEYDYVCSACNTGFMKGSQFDTEKFCSDCVTNLKHVEFFQRLDIPTKDIYDILGTEIKL